MSVTRCSCMHPAPLVRQFGSAYTVICGGCGGNLMHKCDPSLNTKLSGVLGYEFERRGDAFLSVAESLWLQDRREFAKATT